MLLALLWACASGDDAACPKTRWYSDGDGDGYGNPAVHLDACEAPYPFISQAQDCDDSSPSIHPAADEVCGNGVDDDCDGAVDDGAAVDASVFYADRDGDGYGDPETAVSACEQPEDHLETAGDCDDADPRRTPDADEVCDAVDNDCDGQIDEEALDASVFHADADGDGYGDPDVTWRSCELTTGYADDATDCDDTDPATYPDADEHCTGTDNDCDGDVDEEAVDETTWYYDKDGDGYGVDAVQFVACTAPPDHVATGGDCDDRRDYVHPGATETCNHLDDDCDGSTADEAGTASLDGEIDITASVTGAPGAPAIYTLPSTYDSLEFCEGTFYVNLTVDEGYVTGRGPTPADVVLDGDGVGSVLTTSGRYLEVAWITLANGQGSGTFDGEAAGGGMACMGGELTIESVVIDTSDATYGGGLSMDGCIAYINDLTVTTSTAEYGGAVAMRDSDVLLLGTDLSHNDADTGGAIWMSDTEFGGDELTVTDNTATSAAAIYATASNNYQLSIDEAAFTDNVADEGIVVISAVPTDLSETEFTENETSTGAIFQGTDSTYLSLNETQWGRLADGDDNTGMDVSWDGVELELGNSVEYECSDECPYEETDVLGGTTQMAYATTRANVFLADVHGTLHGFSSTLRDDGTCQATPFVAASASLSSGYELEFLGTATDVEATADSVAVDEVGIALEQGRYYAIGWSSDCGTDLAHAYDSTASDDASFGPAQGTAFGSTAVTGSLGSAVSLTIVSGAATLGQELELVVLD